MDTLQTLIVNPLRPLLLPITRSLPSPIDNFLLSLLGPACHTTLLHSLDLTTHPHCLSLLISKLLGYAIITVSSIVKLPQILKLTHSRSATGLSLSSYLLETIGYLVTLAYSIRAGYPFSTFGETGFILVQDVIITALILIYTRRSGYAGAFVALVVAALYAFLAPGTTGVNGTNGLVSDAQMATLQAGAGVLGVASKIPQILTIASAGTTGQLSAFTVFNYLAGSASRIFTTMREVPDDKLILGGYVAGFVLNAVLAGQMLWYWNGDKNAAGKTKTRERTGIEKRPVVTADGVSSGVAKTNSPATRRRG